MIDIIRIDRILLSFILLIALVVVFLPEYTIQQGGVVVIDNKYRDNHPVVLEDVLFGNDISVGVDSKKGCQDQSIDLMWTVNTHSAIAATPIIADLFGQGKKDIILTNTNSYVDVMRGSSGERAIGWPFISPSSTFSSSPILHDIDDNGFDDVVVATREGEILFIGNDGIPLTDYTLKVPPLKIAKGWYQGINSKHVDSTYSLHDNDLNKQFNNQFDNFDDTKYRFNQNLLQDNDIDNILYSKQYERFIRMNKRYSNKSSEHVWVDAHILATPVIADIDADGVMELLVSVSYYFDQEYYRDSVHRSTVDQDVDLNNYVAGGIVCFDLDNLLIKWQTHFDLTVDLKAYSGYIYNTPTLVDINHDGMMEIIVGTSIGHVYVLDVKGKPIDSLTLPLESIYAQVVAEDINNDGNIELLVTDTKGNVVCFSNTGEEIWGNQIVGMTENPVSIGDINGDGILDVVVGSISGAIYAWSGDTGTIIKGFPIKTKSPILSQLLLIDLSPQPSPSNGLSIVVHTQDGVIISINGMNGCVNKLDIGDSSLSLILAEDLTGDGTMNLLITTYYGNIHCFNTNSLYHPLKSRSSSSPLSFSNQGVYIINHQQHNSNSNSNSNQKKLDIVKRYSDSIDILGSEFSLLINVVDHSYNQSAGLINRYKVSIYFSNQLLNVVNYDTPGIKQLVISTPQGGRSLSNLLKVEMTNQYGQSYQDYISCSFNIFFSRILKWIIFIPFILSSMLLLVIIKNNKSQLPTKI